MAAGSFSLSVTRRGNDFVIGGSGALDVDGMNSLRQMLEDSCKNEGASVMLDLMMVSDMHGDVVVHLVKAADTCRGLGVPFSITFNPDLLPLLKSSGYDAELMPLKRG